MPTLTGTWQGSPYQARIKLTYTVTYTADHTQAIYDGEWFIEFEGSVVDSTNSWSLTGAQPDKSGTNRNYNVPSGGGTVNFADMTAFQRYDAPPSVTGTVSGVNAVGGGNITATFTLQPGDLAPYFTDATPSATSTPNSFTVSGYTADGNGGTLNDIQVQYGTTQSTGNPVYERNSYGNPTVSGLTPNTTYYYRIRVSNSTYGWGAWTAWFSIKTAAGTPGTPATTWAMTPSQVGFAISGATVADNGGSTLVGWNTYYNTNASLIGATTHVGNGGTASSWTISGLAPGTYWVAIAARNANGIGTLSGWKQVTLLPAAYVRVGGVWKPASVYVKVGGVWKLATRQTKVGSYWKS